MSAWSTPYDGLPIYKATTEYNPYLRTNLLIELHPYDQLDDFSHILAVDFAHLPYDFSLLESLQFEYGDPFDYTLEMVIDHTLTVLREYHRNVANSLANVFDNNAFNIDSYKADLRTGRRAFHTPDGGHDGFITSYLNPDDVTSDIIADLSGALLPILHHAYMVHSLSGVQTLHPSDSYVLLRVNGGKLFLSTT